MADNEKMVLTKASSEQKKADLARNNSTMAATKLTAAQANLKSSIELVGAKSTLATKKAAAAQASSTMAAASAVAKAKMSQQKSNVMHGRIKQATS